MINKCAGCGDVLLDNSHILCERCFRIQHYNDYKVVVKNNNEFLKILEDINKTNSLVVLVLDLFHLPKNLDVIKNMLKNDILLVLTKRDLLPKSVSDAKFLDYVDKFNIKYVDKVLISSPKNYNFDTLFGLIKKYKNSKEVYVVGFTNAGKSTMINKLIYNYSDNKTSITTSSLPSTTLGTIEIKFNDDLTIIDTPGLLDEGSIINYLDASMLKKINPKKEIRPITYQIRHKQIILVDELLEIECENKNSISLYFSNQLEVKRIYEKRESGLVDHVIEVPERSDIVISGLGFVKVINPDKILIRTLPGVEVFVRDSLIWNINIYVSFFYVII